MDINEGEGETFKASKKPRAGGNYPSPSLQRSFCCSLLPNSRVAPARIVCILPSAYSAAAPSTQARPVKSGRRRPGRQARPAGRARGRPPRRPRGRRHRGGAGRDVRVRRLGQRRGLAADPRPAPLRVGRQPRPPQGRPGGVGQAQGGPAVQVPPPSPSRWPAPVRRGAHWQLLREAIIPGHYSRAKIMAGARYE